MDDNRKKLNFGMRWRQRNQVGDQVEAVFSWRPDLDEQDAAALAAALDVMKREDIAEAVDAGEIHLSAAAFVRLLIHLHKADETLVTRKVSSPDGAQLQLAFLAVALSKEVVKRQDVLAAAFVSSFSVEKCLHVLRDTAVSSDDVMPSWASGNGTFIGMWIPAWSIPELCSIRLSLLSSASSKWHLVGTESRRQSNYNAMDWFLLVSVNTLVRESIEDVSDTSQKSDQAYRVMYRGEADVFEAWANALYRCEDTFTADGWLVARAMHQSLQKSGWASSGLDDFSGKNFYTLSFQLIPPKDALSADWLLVYQVRHRLFGMTAPLSAWWRQSERRWQIGEDTLVAPDSWMLPLLREAARVCEEIAQSLRQTAPYKAVIAADDVYRFLTESVPKLRELGFVIEVPDVLHQNGSRVRIRVRVKRSKKENRHQSQSGPQWFDAEHLVDFDWSVVVDDEEISRESFSQLVANQTPFLQVNGSWRLVPVDEILRQLDELGGINTSTSTHLLDLSRTVLMSSEETDVSVEVDYEADALPIERMMEVLLHAADPLPVAPPHGFHGTLRHYQQFGYSWLLHLRSIECGACLADDMGLGKTVQVLAYLLHLQENGLTAGTHLLICPTSLLPNWQAEIKRFAPALSVYVHHGTTRDLAAHMGESTHVDLVMTTYATLVRDVESLCAYAFDALIVDEAQNIKNTDTKQAKAIRSIWAKHRIALTGTPIENRLEELWALMDFLNPGYLGSAAWFRKKLTEGIVRNPTGEEAAKLQALLRPVLLRRRKSDPDIQTELPDKWEVSEHAYLTTEQAAIYQALVDQLFTDIQPLQGDTMSRRGQILATLVRLKQVCDHPCLISGGSSSSRRSGKLRQLLELLKTVVDDGEAALIFTQFRDMGELICDTIEADLSVRPKFLHGGLTAAARGEMVQDFQRGDDPSPILVLSLRAGGVGLNLTRANHVFHFDRWWNPAVEDQATDRAYRIGQTKDVQVHKMICSGTLEERIDELITQKRELSRAIVGGSNEWVTEMDDEALRSLFSFSGQSVWEEDDA